ncbi:MAG: nucleotidyltransferase domain-containing protein [Chloroflexales bacterium]|nr:nucleotidyltransferase domain-containing protein [Chloroflexales bacterium]
MDLQHTLADYFAARSDIAAAVLFGSAAAGRLRADSDIDLALLFDPAHLPDTEATMRLRADIEELTRRDVDLVVLNRTSTILAFQALKTGTLIFCRNRKLFEAYVVRLISEYADFKRIRRPIEEAVIARRIYG